MREATAASTIKDGRWELDIEALIAALTPETKAVVINSPNNPTGNSISKEKITELLHAFNGIVVIDEAYIDFSPTESWVSKLAKFPNLIVTQTLSKAYGMAGIRLGVCIGSKEIISVLNKIKPPYNVNALTQLKALERVVNTKAVAEEVTSILNERNRLIPALETVSFVEVIYPTDANFVLAKVDDANKRYSQLLKMGIVVRNRSTQALCENTLRFTVGTPEENKKLIEVLKNNTNE